MPGDAGGKIDIFDNAALVKLEQLLGKEQELQQRALKERDKAERRNILEQSELRKEAINDAYNYKAQKLQDEYNKRLEIETAVNKKLIDLNMILNEEDLKNRKKNAAAALEDRKQKELEAARKERKDSTNLKEFEKELDKKYELEQKKQDSLLENKFKKDRKYADKLRGLAKVQQAKEDGKQLQAGLFGAGLSVTARKEALKAAFTDEQGERDISKGLSAMTSALSDLAKKLDKSIDDIGSHLGTIDTRLQGSKNATNFAGSYWSKLNDDLNKLVGVSPFIKQEKVVENLESLVKKGIAYNVEQRAFLQTISERIASTFNAADGTLLRLIRIQQQDSTAGRLGMESALNSFLNNMYETSEYLSDLAASVRGSLAEAEALMDTAAATELEWQVQKWLGSMYSVGVSDKTVQSIADAVGKIASGDIGGITSGGTGNLVIMAANEAGLSIQDILKEGLDSSNANRLMTKMVDFLAKIYNNAKDSKVIQQQLANVYGLSASDLKALTNLASGDIVNINSKN